jgi:hypothetical protein
MSNLQYISMVTGKKYDKGRAIKSNIGSPISNMDCKNCLPNSTHSSLSGLPWVRIPLTVRLNPLLHQQCMQG